MMAEIFGFSIDKLRAATSDDAVIGRLLERNAREQPDEVFVRFDDGTGWTRREALDRAQAAAAALHAHGIGPGGRVGIFLPNGPDFLTAWWGTALLGATTVPLNTAFRGDVLERAIRLADLPLIVTEPNLGGRIDDLAMPVTRLEPSALAARRASIPDLPTVHLWDDQLLVQTSGTTGPSRFVRVSHLSPYAGYASILASQHCTAEDVFQIDLPMFHMAAVGFVQACLITRTRMVVRARPALDRYWQAISNDEISCGILLSSMVPYMLSQPPTPSERGHRMRFMMSAPVPPDVTAFKQRFDIRKLLAMYGSTEVSAALVGEDIPGVPQGFCGGPRPGWELRLVDENDQDIPMGQVGEAIVRADRPFMMCSGYFGDDQATASAWRHGWYHTGDLLRANDDGTYSFIDRAGDAIRRRGENISGFEIETVIAQHPDIAEAACVAVVADTGVEHEIKAWIVSRDRADIDFVALLKYCAKSLPHSMVPRYFERTDSLPKTPTAKVQKHLLRTQGITETTWDSHHHGLVVTRRGLEAP
jgi:crotonobetaine/carnitine-CoA ligase